MTGPWRVLILDRAPDDPRWIVAAVNLPDDVCPAALDAAGRYQAWPDIAAWAQARVGRPVALVPVRDALAWRIDEGGIPR